MQPDRGLYTPEMEQAERELDGRIDHALSVARRVEEQVAEFEQRFSEKEPPSDEDVERMKKYILGHAMTEQWRQVVERINRGELTWRGIVDGLFNGTLDRQVSAAFASLSRVPPASQEDLIALGVLPAPPPDKPTDETGAAADRAKKADGDDDQWFDEDPIGRVTR